MMSSKHFLGMGVLALVVVACGGSVSLGDGTQGLGAGASDSGTSKKDCTAPNACGPALGMPAQQCPDGTIGGNTGKCIETSTGCGWEIRQCGTGSDGGAGACFGSDGELDSSLRTCATNADCTSVTFQKDCCGTMRAAGVNTASSVKAKACGDDRGSKFPACGCASQGTVADDGTSALTEGAQPTVSCSKAGLCETTFGQGATCGAATCQPGQTCCTGQPFATPTCVNGNMCPISRREYKKDISYLADGEREQLREDLLRTRLATYHYKAEEPAERRHLGFIINDMGEQSPAVEADKQHVDLYGYTSMTVATLQLQQQQIAAMEKQINDLRRELATKPTCAKPSR